MAPTRVAATTTTATKTPGVARAASLDRCTTTHQVEFRRATFCLRHKAEKIVEEEHPMKHQAHQLPTRHHTQTLNKHSEQIKIDGQTRQRRGLERGAVTTWSEHEVLECGHEDVVGTVVQRAVLVTIVVALRGEEGIKQSGSSLLVDLLMTR